MEYLEVNRPNKRYCDGCPCLNNLVFDYYCKALPQGHNFIDVEMRTPPNCPLKSEIDCPRCDSTFDIGV
jgi:hypothetical protein